jgi:hypothetical protein
MNGMKVWSGFDERKDAMTCEEVETLLLQSEMNQAPDGVSVRLSGDAAPLVAEHVAGHVARCASCNRLASKLRRLEKAVRSLPEPPDSTDARLRFAAQLQSLDIDAGSDDAADLVPAMPRLVAPRRRAVPKSSILWRIADSRLTAAALLMLVVGGSIWAYHHRQQQVLASAQTLDKLVVWNLRLTQSVSPAERRKLYAISAESVKQQTGQASLTSADRKDAEALLQNGAFLADNQDPLAEADHFSDVADLLVTKMDFTADKSPEAMDQLSQAYYSVVNQGIQKNLDRAEASGVNTPATQKQMEKIDQRNTVLMSKVQALLDKSPPASRSPLRKALDLHQQKTQQRKSNAH